MKEVSVLVILEVPEGASNQELETYIDGIFEGRLVRVRNILIPQEIEIQRGPRPSTIEEALSDPPVIQEVVTCQAEVPPLDDKCGLPVVISSDGKRAECKNGHSYPYFSPLRLG